MGAEAVESARPICKQSTQRTDNPTLSFLQSFMNTRMIVVCDVLPRCACD